LPYAEKQGEDFPLLTVTRDIVYNSGYNNAGGLFMKKLSDH